MKERPEISRREFLKLVGASLPYAFLPIREIDKIADTFNPHLSLLSSDSKREKPISETLKKSRSVTAIQAASYAQSLFGKEPYKFGARDCAMFAAQFASYYGIPLERNASSIGNYDPKFPQNLLPDATTVKQVEWFKMINQYLGGQDLISYPKNGEIAKEDFWVSINPGSLIYLRTAGESQHGYDQYSHVAAFVGLNQNSEPIFAEYAPGMEKGPETNRTLRQLMSMYRGKIPKDLQACIVNVPEMAVRLWKDRNEKVIPNSKILLRHDYKRALTVNINSGITTYWEYEDGQWVQRKFANGAWETYGVTGRHLLPKSTLTERYNEFIKNPVYQEQLRFSSYGIPAEKTACFYGPPLPTGVPRFYLTPPLILELSGFAWVANFGNLGGATYIALTNVLYRSETGKIIKEKYGSDYTMHATPQRTRSQQDLLLRDYILDKANQKGTPPDPSSVHLTSGCVNFTSDTFRVIEKTIQPGTAVILSYPDFPCDLQLNHNGFSLAKDPLGGLSSHWGYAEI